MKFDITINLHISSINNEFVKSLQNSIEDIKSQLTKTKKEILTKMSEFTDALTEFQTEQNQLLLNVDNEIAQVLAAINAGNTNAADLRTGLEAIRAATQSAREANARLTADDSPVVVAVPEET